MLADEITELVMDGEDDYCDMWYRGFGDLSKKRAGLNVFQAGFCVLYEFTVPVSLCSYQGIHKSYL